MSRILHLSRATVPGTGVELLRICAVTLVAVVSAIAIICLVDRFGHSFLAPPFVGEWSGNVANDANTSSDDEWPVGWRSSVAEVRLSMEGWSSSGDGLLRVRLAPRNVLRDYGAQSHPDQAPPGWLQVPLRWSRSALRFDPDGIYFDPATSRIDPVLAAFFTRSGELQWSVSPDGQRLTLSTARGELALTSVARR